MNEQNQIKPKKNHNVLTILALLAFIVVAAALTRFAMTEIASSDTPIIPDSYDGDYIQDYSLEQVGEERFIVEGTVIPVVLTEWKIENHGNSYGYPAAMLEATQGDVVLIDAETLLCEYDDSGREWDFSYRYANLEPGESRNFYTAYVLKDIGAPIEYEWSDLGDVSLK